MDGDIFWRARRLGRDAANQLRDGLSGAPVDPFLFHRCIELAFNAAGGVSSIPEVLRQLRSLGSEPLLIPLPRDAALDEIESIVRARKRTPLDTVWLKVAQMHVEKRDHDELRLLTAFCLEIFDRHVISAKGGLIEQMIEIPPARVRDEARRFLEPIANKAARAIARRPDAQRINITRKYAQVDPDTNLLASA